jgi:hypothetical protein
MQTFLPYEDFFQSAAVLDYRRLGKQRVETWQILRALNGETRGWTSHPASKMWRGHELLLIKYGIVICQEWVQRGYKDTMLSRFEDLSTSQRLNEDGAYDRPEWLGNPEFHLSHQSNLVRKDPEYYEPIFPGVPADLEYLWPVS